MYYYKVPGNDDDKKLFYGDLYEIFFLNVSKNAEYENL